MTSFNRKNTLALLSDGLVIAVLCVFQQSGQLPELPLCDVDCHL